MKPNPSFRMAPISVTLVTLLNQLHEASRDLSATAELLLVDC